MEKELISPKTALTLYNVLAANKFERVFEAYGENPNIIFLLVKSLDLDDRSMLVGRNGYFYIKFNGENIEKLSKVIHGLDTAESYFRKMIEKNVEKFGVYKVWDNTKKMFW